MMKCYTTKYYVTDWDSNQTLTENCKYKPNRNNSEPLFWREVGDSSQSFSIFLYSSFE